MKLKHIAVGIILGVLTLPTLVYANSEDTLVVNMNQADSLFLMNNFALLAQKYQISSDQALIQQAKLWPNLTFNTELGMHNTTHPQLFDIGPNGRTTFSVDQVIKLAGQRNKNIKLAQLNADYSVAAFAELLRTLKFQLRSSFFNLYYKKQTLSILLEQERVLDNIVAGYRKADKNGSVAHADFVRLLALKLSLKNDYLSVLNEVLDAQQNFQQLLGSAKPIAPILETQTLANYNLAPYSLAALLDMAKEDRPDIKMSSTQLQSSKVNYALQKSLAVPDLHIGADYDKQGYIKNYIGITAGIDLPFWNRNQGNIKAAQFQINQSNTQLEQQQNIAATEVSNVFEKVKAYNQSFSTSDLKAFDSDYKILMEQVAQNFTKGNINMLQFIDYFDSYSNNAKDLNAYYASLYIAYEELSFAVGKNLYQ